MGPQMQSHTKILLALTHGIICSLLQESAELRLPIDTQELNSAAQQARGGGSLAKAEVMLEMRAQLSTSMPWAPMVRLDSLMVLSFQRCM